MQGRSHKCPPFPLLRGCPKGGGLKGGHDMAAGWRLGAMTWLLQHPRKRKIVYPLAGSRKRCIFAVSFRHVKDVQRHDLKGQQIAPEDEKHWRLEPKQVINRQFLFYRKSSWPTFSFPCECIPHNSILFLMTYDRQLCRDISLVRFRLRQQ